MTHNAKAVYFTVAGFEINVIVLNKHFNLLMEALLKKIFITVRTVDIELPDVEAIYKQARQEAEADIDLSNSTYNTTTTDLIGTADITSVWYKSLSKGCTVLAAKAVVDGHMCTVLHNRTFTPAKAHKLCTTIRQAGKIDLTHWRK